LAVDDGALLPGAHFDSCLFHSRRHQCHLGLAGEPRLGRGHHPAHVARAGRAEFGHQSCHLGGDLLGRQSLRQIGLEYHDLGGFLVGKVDTAALAEGRDRIPALLDQLVDDADDSRIVEHDALVDFALLHRRHQQADGGQAGAVARAHGGLHVVRDAVLQRDVRGHWAVLQMTKARDGGPCGPASRWRTSGSVGIRRRAETQASTRQYIFLGSCMLRTRL
jgi:hypothetical protein